MEELKCLKVRLAAAETKAEEQASQIRDQADEISRLYGERNTLLEKSDEINTETLCELERVEQEMAETLKQIAEERDTARHEANSAAEERDEAKQSLLDTQVA